MKESSTLVNTGTATPSSNSNAMIVVDSYDKEGKEITDTSKKASDGDGRGGYQAVQSVEGGDNTSATTTTATTIPTSNNSQVNLTGVPVTPTSIAQINRSFYTLQDVSCHIPKGALVAIIGNVGSGKSSFLAALLGEMNLQSGSVHMSGTVSYCDQRPWILNSTLRDNILFNRAYDEELFDKAVHVSNLEDDILVLPGGVYTEIGEKGKSVVVVVANLPLLLTPPPYSITITIHTIFTYMKTYIIYIIYIKSNIHRNQLEWRPKSACGLGSSSIS